MCFIALRSVHKCSCCMIGPLSSAPGAFLQGRPQIQEKQEEDEKEEQEKEEQEQEEQEEEEEEEDEEEAEEMCEV